MACEAILVGDGPVRCITRDEAACYRGAGFVWVHMENGEPDDLATLRGQEDIPDVAANALVATETRPRCERIENGALVNMRGLAAEETDDSDRLVSIRFWVRQGRINSVTSRPLAATRLVLEQMRAGEIHDPGDVVAAFARAISTGLDPEVAELGDRLDTCESSIEPREVYKLRSTIAEVRSAAISYRRFVAPDRDALLALAQMPVAWLAEDDRLHIREAADRFARMAEELEAVRERAALLQDQLGELRAEQMEVRALVLSIVALVFLPLTFITGLMGMNVPVPGADNPHAFTWILVICGVITLGIVAYFARLHWLRR